MTIREQIERLERRQRQDDLLDEMLLLAVAMMVFGPTTVQRVLDQRSQTP